MPRKFKNKIFLLIGMIAILTIIAINHYKPQVLSVKNSQTLGAGYQIVDGDTIRKGKIRIRLWGIDAPELKQSCYQNNIKIKCGQKAKIALIEIVKDKELICETVDTDRYQRQVSRCKAGNIEINKTMVDKGWALDYTQYSKGNYTEAEAKAKAQKLGVWAYQFERPSDWRRGNRQYH